MEINGGKWTRMAVNEDEWRCSDIKGDFEIWVEMNGDDLG